MEDAWGREKIYNKEYALRRNYPAVGATYFVIIGGPGIITLGPNAGG